jgi:hypothetical protein
VKTTVYSEDELDKLDAWVRCVGSSINIHGSTIRFADYEEKGYYKHLDHPSRWRLGKAIEQGIWSSIRLSGCGKGAFPPIHKRSG